MKVTPSPLKLVDLSVINLVCHFIAPKKQIDVNKLFESYEVDINFGVAKQSNANSFQLFMKAEINYDQSLALQKEGYAMLIECAGIFTIEGAEKSVQLTNSALVMMLNFLRTKLADYTAQFPFGIYFIPSIDLNELVKEKQKTLTPKKGSKKK